MKHLVSLFALVFLCGCATAHPGEEPNGNATTGIVRRAVCIGLLNTAEGDAECPGTDVDAKRIMGWLKDRPATLLMDAQASVAGIQAAVRAAAAGMGPEDLLTVSISGHGTRRRDTSGDEADGYDEGLVVWDRVWWDDDVWKFICTLPPCRLELITDTCHAEGNFRSRAYRWTRWQWLKPQYTPFEVGAEPRATWGGQLIQFAACREDSYAYGGAAGGTSTLILGAMLKDAVSRTNWFDRARALMPDEQTPAWATYNASEEFIHGEPLK